jgi:peptidoglycan hydrolase-like protein with peptidoglycan-binding domain/transcriptional regulator with XRE-family HTH domain
LSDSRSVEDLSLLLRQLKERTGRSYEALAKRANISRSALHRYCSGAAVPPEFDVVNRLGRACGASREELLELHRRWAVASAAQADLAASSPVPAAAGTAEPPVVAEAEGSSAVGVLTETPAAPVPDAADAEPVSAPPAVTARQAWWADRRLLVGVVALAVLGVAGAIALYATRQTDQADGRHDSRMLFSSCGERIAMGQVDQCVREVQRLLKKSGTQIDVDGAFGPQTLRRVTAFQLLAGLPPTGEVHEDTKRALYDGKVSMVSWPKARVEARIRAVFVEEPERAVRVAQCASFLDPVYVLPNTDGSRNWGVFQLSDAVLAKFNGTRKQAFDPDWNIVTAHRSWLEHRDFRNWEHCDSAAAPPTPSAPATPTPSAPAPTAGT